MKRLAMLCACVLLAEYCAVRGLAGPAMVLPPVGEPTPWTRQGVLDPVQEFQFAIVSDRNGGMRPGVFEDAVRKLDLLQPEFVISVGDLIPGYTEEPKKLEAQWADIEATIGRLDMRYFHVPGNHDLTNAVERQDWARRFGPAYYHFVYRNALFLVLNTEETDTPGISSEQADYVARALAENKDVRWTFVFMHEPLWTSGYSSAGWKTVDALLADRPHTVFAGHVHRYTKYVRGGYDYYVLATTGAGSELTGPREGQFDEIVWVTMTPKGPSVVNIDLTGIWDKDVLTETADALRNKLARGEVALAPIAAGAGPFGGGTSELRVSNPGETPMTFSGAFRAHRLLRPDPEFFDFVVPPGSAEVRQVKVTAVAAAQVGEVPPLELAWTVRTGPAGKEPIEVKDSSALGVDSVIACPRRDKPVKVDGRLDDWPDLPLTCRAPQQILLDPDTWFGPDDGSFRFATAYDDDNLYIAVEVTDDRMMFDPGRSVWEQDGLELRLDARPDPARSQGRGDAEGTDFMVFAVGPGRTPAEAATYGPMNSPGAPQVAWSRTGGNYTVEIAVPASYLNKAQGGRWGAFRLNIAMDDFDYPGRPGAQLWWRPDWRHSLNYVGSGTFKRQ